MESERPLRILAVITPTHYSGAERALTALAGELTRQGHEVLVVSKPLPLLRQELEQRGVECRELPLSGKGNPAVAARLWRLIRIFRPDVVNTHLSTASWWGTVAAHAAGRPCVAHYHGLSCPWWYRRADRVIVPSEGLRQYLLGRGWRPERVHAVYYGLEADGFTDLPPRERVRRELGLSTEVPLVGVVAHLTPRKGHRVLLEALAQLAPRHPDLHALVIGQGPLREELEDWCQGHGLAERVLFLGYRHEAISLIGALDIAVLPSLHGEGLGLCLLEAARLGVPGVGSDIAGINEAIVDGATGLLFPPGDAAALAGTLDRLLDDPPLRERLGRAGRERMAASFDLATQARETVAVFRRALG